MLNDSQGRTSTGIYYELHGGGSPLVLAFPMMASYAEIFGVANASVLDGFLERLTDRYRVLLLDYPSIGKSAAIPPEQLSVDRVCADMLSVADAAGFDRFAWWGATWGAAVGLQLASRSKRVSALVCGGWPPLGGPAADMLRACQISVSEPPASALVVLREPRQYSQWITFWESFAVLSERGVLAGITCPSMVYAGSDHEVAPAGVTLRIAAILRERRAELEALGWHVSEIPRRDSHVLLDPAVVVPVVREFLDRVS